jgi:putative SOS response-associated peptidase YedK
VCGRFTSLLSPELLETIFGVKPPVAMLAPRYNIAPTQNILILRENESRNREYAEARWGLVPHWAKDITIGNKLINARCETVAEKPSFRNAIKHRRCIIPTSGFYEWKTIPSGKQPHYITLKAGDPLCFAGIWESWHDPDGVILESCALLTTDANLLMATIHERMPVILQPSDFNLWLDRSITDPPRLQHLYRPFPDDQMQEWPVSTFVNSPAHNSIECLQPVTTS